MSVFQFSKQKFPEGVIFQVVWVIVKCLAPNRNYLPREKRQKIAGCECSIIRRDNFWIYFLINILVKIIICRYKYNFGLENQCPFQSRVGRFPS